MCKLVFLIIPVFQGNEDSQVVGSSHDTHTRTSELCAQLIVASCTDTLLRTIDVKGRNRGMMRRLLGKVGYCHSLAVAFGAAGGAGGCRVGRLQGKVGVFNFPVTLRELASQLRTELLQLHTLKNSPKVEL